MREGLELVVDAPPAVEVAHLGGVLAKEEGGSAGEPEDVLCGRGRSPKASAICWRGGEIAEVLTAWGKQARHGVVDGGEQQVAVGGEVLEKNAVGTAAAVDGEGLAGG